jgi:DNA polymerase III epsilon subunit family exonuclease
MHISDDHLIAVFDVETTGLSAAYGDRICEVGIVCARGDEIIDTYQSLVNPQRPISPGAAQVNGLSDAQVCQAPVFAEVAAEVLAHMDGATLVCHNAPFDLSFLEAELARLGLTRPPIDVLDTLDIARRYYRFRSNSLSSVAANLRIVNVQAHRALGDALTTFYVFRTFYRQLSERGVFLGPQGGGADVLRSRSGPNGILQRNTDTSHHQAAPAQSEILLPPVIQAAISANKTIEIIYLDAQGNRTCRRITPRLALAQNGSVQLVAFCHLRQAERSFRLDRIVAIQDDRLPSQE